MKFSITNYGTFKDRTVLSMEATKDRTLEENSVTVGVKEHKLLKSAMIYGANASGKTTLFNGMMLFRNFVILSHAHADNQLLNYSPFAFDKECLGKPTSFEAEFFADGVRYDYGFSYDSERITEEFLYYYPNGKRTTVFKRVGQEYEFTVDKKFQKENSRRVREKSLYVSVSAQFNQEVCRKVVNWFMGEVLMISGYDVNHSLDVLTKKMETDETFRRLALKAFKIADFGVTGVTDKLKSDLAANNPNMMQPPLRLIDIWVQHKIEGNAVELPIAAESSGTIRFFSVIGPVIDALMKGSVIVIDELDMSFHTDVCQWITDLFLDPVENKNNAQLLINTHDAELLDRNRVRRDQIWLTSKDWKTGASELHSLSEFGIRKDVDLRKAYLNGSFGAKPFIAPERLME